jgi:hypothetical protein
LQPVNSFTGVLHNGTRRGGKNGVTPVDHALPVGIPVYGICVSVGSSGSSAITVLLPDRNTLRLIQPPCADSVLTAYY